MVEVNWHGAVAFCKWLTQRERAAGRLPAGYEYRLPTEAEWEYACRAGTTTRFHFGDSARALRDYAWYSSNAGGRTHEVGQKKPNQWGLYDMHGNVWEWCHDWYADEYPGGTVTDPSGPQSATDRVYRCGSWYDTARNCRAANRYGRRPGFANIDVGFRVALAPQLNR